jgi:thiol-disulfide isomerase/thioredoxin
MNFENRVVENGGKKYKRRTAKKRDVVIVGKIYADWCGHCQTLGPEWKKMKTLMHKKKGKKHLVYAEIEEKEIESKLRKLEKDHRVTVSANGFPTLFRIEKGKVVYYDGERRADKMSEWFLRGGGGGEEQPGMPGLMRDQQGGKTRYYKKVKNPNHPSNRKTRKHRGGILGFLFGK